MTNPHRPDFRAALSNRTIQMTIGAFALIAAAAGTALAMQAPAPVNAADRTAIEKMIGDPGS
jgi:hypothetical protein